MADASLVSAGDLYSPAVYSTDSEFLYFGNIPLITSASNFKLVDGIPLVLQNGKFHYDPVSIMQYGLQQYSFYKYDKDETHVQNIKTVADWLVDNQDKKSGKWLYNFQFAVGGTSSTLAAGWSSSMGQGQGISLLARAYLLTGNESYLNAAKLALEPLKLSVAEGGLHETIGGYNFYTEYPTSPPDYTLNGYMFTLFGIYDLSIVTNDTDAAKMFNDGITLLCQVLPYYDLPDKKISAYNLSYLTESMDKAHTSKFYHKVHIIQLNALYSVTGNKTLYDYMQKWKSYIE